jgi:hypothetical protein
MGLYYIAAPQAGICTYLFATIQDRQVDIVYHCNLSSMHACMYAYMCMCIYVYVYNIIFVPMRRKDDFTGLDHTIADTAMMLLYRH